MGDNMTINVGSHTLSITKKVPVDESIVSYVYREYEPTNPAALNSGQVIEITVLNQDVYTQPSSSFLLIGGRESESRFLTTHQHILGYTMSFTLYDLHTMDSRQLKMTDDRLQ